MLIYLPFKTPIRQSNSVYQYSCAISNNERVNIISTYRLDRKKAPHWGVNSGYDKQYFYLDDPDPDEKFQDYNDCQYLPIRFDDFERMSVFAASRIITSIQINK